MSCTSARGTLLRSEVPGWLDWFTLDLMSNAEAARRSDRQLWCPPRGRGVTPAEPSAWCTVVFETPSCLATARMLNPDRYSLTTWARMLCVIRCRFGRGAGERSVQAPSLDL